LCYHSKIRTYENFERSINLAKWTAKVYGAISQ